jgi:eukaryotic-like serine/threonine-protein kinase
MVWRQAGLERQSLPAGPECLFFGPTAQCKRTVSPCHNIVGAPESQRADCPITGFCGLRCRAGELPGDAQCVRNRRSPLSESRRSATAHFGLGTVRRDRSSSKIFADKISKQFPENTLWHTVKLPAIQAVLELRRHHPDQAVELLRSATPYERRFPYVMYLRGLAYLDARDGPKAAVEFRKILDHKGAYWMSAARGPYFPLCYLGLARAAAMSGDTAKAKKAYQDFFTLWKDADPDLAPLIQARKEYAALPASQ